MVGRNLPNCLLNNLLKSIVLQLGDLFTFFPPRIKCDIQIFLVMMEAVWSIWILMNAPPPPEAAGDLLWRPALAPPNIGSHVPFSGPLSSFRGLPLGSLRVEREEPRVLVRYTGRRGTAHWLPRKSEIKSVCNKQSLMNCGLF